MSKLKERLMEDMKKAMKAKDKERLSVIRMTRSEIKNKEIETGEELNDQEVTAVIAKQVKQIKDSLSDFEKSGKKDVMEKLHNEIKILQEYLPEQMSEAEVDKLVDQVIEETGAENMSDMGQVMGAIMPKIKGKADGSMVSSKVKEKLSN
ncbi:Transamidase GatB domain protein [Halanaerobium saccharolyticum subsp. saccharolyticum DSM 6643]|uniref:Transamidase GatB domain protein n=1 Tax=Halanaerobium saccharolyticum subsp. saccharolyticum DSM 6643 TaxID=1293054 RepID=M5E3N5_9FIRM|nr:GatB/YqeY domain-containing protein [Halanaerobium saccharolyticum]CCU80460.1 Transamidase GatB domain protein [Halanaerobium saccharolyticum subsp. saccharolyticum DSM 6643]